MNTCSFWIRKSCVYLQTKKRIFDVLEALPADAQNIQIIPAEGISGSVRFVFDTDEMESGGYSFGYVDGKIKFCKFDDLK